MARMSAHTNQTGPTISSPSCAASCFGPTGIPSAQREPPHRIQHAGKGFGSEFGSSGPMLSGETVFGGDIDMARPAPG
jgi:hypothetical protein